MKTTETVLVVSALAAAVALVFLPRRAAAAPAARDLLRPSVGGQAGDLWSDARTAAYRENMAREDWSAL